MNGKLASPQVMSPILALIRKSNQAIILREQIRRLKETNESLKSKIMSLSE